MRKMVVVRSPLLLSVLLGISVPTINADEVPEEYKPVIHRGLEWLANQQLPDGHWVSMGSNPYPQAMTGLSSVALLMEGSTLRGGKYADCLKRAVQWCILQSQPNGLIGDAKEDGHYMYGHGYCMLFLSSIYGEECDAALRRQLEDVLARAVIFSGRAQSVHGGWHYVSAADAGGGGTDSSATVTQMQALRAARNAGIVVPKEIIDKGLDYLRQTTNSDDGVSYGWEIRNSRPALTAAALASSFSAGEYNSDLVKRWLKYCQKHIPMGPGSGMGHDEYTYCYLAQALYNLGSDRYAQLFPHASPQDHMMWPIYRKTLFGRIARVQGKDGRWKGRIGDVYHTAMYLIVMQLDNAVLPIFQR